MRWRDGAPVDVNGDGDGDGDDRNKSLRSRHGRHSLRFPDYRCPMHKTKVRRENEINRGRPFYTFTLSLFLGFFLNFSSFFKKK